MREHGDHETHQHHLSRARHTGGSNSLRGHNRYSESYPVGSQHSVGAPIASGGTTVTPKVTQWARLMSIIKTTPPLQNRPENELVVEGIFNSICQHR